MKGGTKEQALEALKEANVVRRQRSEMKAGFRERTMSPIDVLDELPGYVERMPVATFLRAVPRIGKGREQEILRRTGISAGREIGSLTDRQRLLLADEIKERSWI